MSRKIEIFISAVALIGLMLIGNVVAYYRDEDSLKNILNVGTIEIDVTETGEDVENNSNSYVLYPGVTSIKDPKIEVKGNACYIQVQTIIKNIHFQEEYKKALKMKYKVSKDIDLTNKIMQEIDSLIKSEIMKVDITVADKLIKWNRINGCYYINKVFYSGDIVPVFKSVTIPNSYGNMWKGISFTVEIKVAAVQAENQPRDKDIYINAFKR